MVAILICGEGKHEVGEDIWSKRSKSSSRQEGWMQPVLRQCLHHDVEFFTKRRNELILSPRQTSRHKPLPDGHGKKALMAKLIAAQQGFDSLVYMVDADSNNIRDWTRVYKEVTDGFSRVNNNVRSIPCVPMSACESWLLADPRPWADLGLTDVTVLPDKPERIWGARDDPYGGHPHRYFARICRVIDVEDGLFIRHNVAMGSSPDEIRKKCPISFGQFVADLGSSATSHGGPDDQRSSTNTC